MTLIRKPADPFRADVLRGERSSFDGEIIGEDRCESARRENRGESEWSDYRCQLPVGHEAEQPHRNGDMTWEGDRAAL